MTQEGQEFKNKCIQCIYSRDIMDISMTQEGREFNNKSIKCIYSRDIMDIPMTQEGREFNFHVTDVSHVQTIKEQYNNIRFVILF